ncbi:MAG: bifunctional folylpolyglutamate synthase/dihydrofolate synthase [Pelagibacteraceae bacterium]|nr:bifunctional folylpolyglutamate synthase/dihydrofolate synthase [Pelagibacteraceae bacterium]MCI5079638.1 bifunctional folylpolyglutamate synthase/dihydrofolate synthase [Pelagibacteraceae bacterium]
MSHSKKLQFILNKLYELNPDKIELKLDRVLRLANDLGNPHKKLKNVITVTGTNGKGGTAFYLKEILQAHGYSVALFQSPFLYNFLTRFLINGEPLDEEKFINYVIEVDKANNNQDITFFEYITCIAFKAFEEANCDFNIMETGLGGKYDSTNVDYQDLKAQALTPISMDHKDFLGDNLKEITHNKCGIIKDNSNVIIAKQSSEVLGYIDEELKRKKIKKYIFSEDFNVSVENNRMIYQDDDGLIDLDMPTMKGSFQIQNAAVALKALKSIGLKLDNKKISEGIKNTKIEGRIQHITKGKLLSYIHEETNTLIIDGGHNEQAGKSLAEYLEKIKGKRSIYLVFSMLTSKDLKAYLSSFSSLVTEIKCFKLRENFYETKDIIAQAKELGIHANPNNSATEAIAQLAIQDPNAIIVVCGSLYSAGKVLEQNI